MTRRIVAMATLVAVGAPAAARAEGQAWVTASVTAALTGRLRVNLEVQPRWERDISEYTQTVARGQVGRVFSNTMIVWGGFEYHDPAGPTARREHRVWQSLSWTSRAGAWTLAQRARLEERSLALAPSLVLRARYQLRATRPLRPHSPWGVIAVGEMFVTLRGSSPGPSQGVDRGRLAGGLSRRLTPQLAIDAGYVREYVNQPAPTANQVNNSLVANVAMRFPATLRTRPAD